MKLTDIKMRFVSTDSRLKAIATLTFDDEFVVHDVKVIGLDDRLFLAMPSRRMPNGTYRDIAHPINRNMRERLEYEVLGEYEKLLLTNADVI